MVANLDGLNDVTLLGRHELDAALEVPVFVPVDKRRQPLAGLALAGNWPTRVITLIYFCAQQLI